MTSLQKFNTAFCILNIIICSVLLLDDFVTGTYTETEICKEKKITISYDRRVGSDWKSFLIKTYTKKEFNLSSKAYYSIAENDSFTIHRTNILKKAIGVTFVYNGYFYSEKIGVINGNGFGLFVIILCLTASLLLLAFTIILKKKFEARHILMFSFICLVIIYFYFFYQS